MLFKKYGGLSADVMKYYFHLFNTTQLDTMRALPAFDQLIEKLKILNTINSHEIEKILQLYIFTGDEPAQNNQKPPQIKLQQAKCEEHIFQEPVIKNKRPPG